MRQESIRISERTFVEALAASIYGHAPNKQPRKVETIMIKARDAFRNHEMCYNDNEYRTISLPLEEMRKQFYEMLRGIEELCELNLTQIEFEQGIKWDDPNRSGYKIVTRFDVHDSESWKTDFIDLDALIPNAICMMEWMTNSDCDHDCSFCANKPEGCGPCGVCSDLEENLCDKCTNNPSHSNNYKSRRFPRGEYTFACKFDCPECKYICCEECPKKDGCKHRCDGESKTCGNAINHRTESEEVN